MSKIEVSKLPTVPVEEAPIIQKLIGRFRQHIDEENRQRIDNMSPDEARQKLSRYFQETK